MRFLPTMLVAVLAVQAHGQQSPVPVATNPSSLPPHTVISVATPLYPDTLQRARIHGVVAISALLSPGGATKRLSVLHGVHPTLDTSCLEAVEHIRFNPISMADDRSVVFTFSFELSAQSRERTFVVSEGFPFAWRVRGWAQP